MQHLIRTIKAGKDGESNLARFVPGMRSSRIVSAPGEPLLLEQKGESGLLLFRVPIEVVSRVEEAPLTSIRFNAQSSSSGSGY